VVRPTQSEPESKLGKAGHTALNVNLRKLIQKWIGMEVISHEFKN